MKPVAPALTGGFFTTEPPGEGIYPIVYIKYTYSILIVYIKYTYSILIVYIEFDKSRDYCSMKGNWETEREKRKWSLP